MIALRSQTRFPVSYRIPEFRPPIKNSLPDVPDWARVFGRIVVHQVEVATAVQTSFLHWRGRVRQVDVLQVGNKVVVREVDQDSSSHIETETFNVKEQ